jgi:hypothetical protein
LPGSGFTIASCSAYITMNGVTIPVVSAGSNHVGARKYGCPRSPGLRGRAGSANAAGQEDQQEHGSRQAADSRHCDRLPVDVVVGAVETQRLVPSRIPWFSPGAFSV